MAEQFAYKSGSGLNKEIYICTLSIDILILPTDYKRITLEYGPKAYPRYLYVNILPCIYSPKLGYFDL